MKKIFTLALVALIAMTTNARKWDFTNWSAATVENLMKGAGVVNPENGWSDIEKAANTAPTATSANNCFWEVTAQGNASSGAQLKANGQVIAELDGLLYTNTSARSLAIAVNYPVATVSSKDQNYHGPSYLWFGGSKKNYVVIPNVAAGTTIKAGVESHNLSDPRGVELYVVKKGAYGTKGSKLNDPDGAAVAVPTTYQDQVWLLNEDALTETDKAMANEDGTYDVLIYNTNGCHLYYLEVVESKDVDEDKNIAIVVGSEDDIVPAVVAEMSGLNATVIAQDAEVTVEGLAEYDAVILAPTVEAASPVAKFVEEKLGFFPVVNLNANLFGYEAVENEEATLYAMDESHGLFTDVELEDGTFSYLNAATPAVALPEKFAADKVVAIAGENEEAVMAHQHSVNRNSYLFLNTPVDAEGEIVNYETWPLFFSNAINVVAATKKPIASAAKPAITATYGDGTTDVTVSCATANSTVYVSVNDGEFAKYEGAITLTEEATIKAYAIAEGYNQSETAEFTAVIKTMAQKPAIKAESTTEKITVTIEAAEGAKVYYNFSGKNTAEESALYTAPVEISSVASTTIYAFAEEENKLASEIASEEVRLEVTEQSAASVRLDEIAHCDFNAAEWFTAVEPVCTEKWGGNGKESAYYYWGKSAWNYYKLDADGIRINEGTEEEPVYIPNPDALKTVEPGNGWIIKSYGQASTYEGIASAGGVANGRTGRYADSIEDLVAGEPSKGLIDFGGKTSGDPYSMSVETTAKYAGPFDIVTYLGNGGTSDLGIEAQVSTDGETWEKIGNLNYTTSQRYWKRTKLSYEGTDEVYVRVVQVSGGSKGQLYDIILLNNGEKSKEYTPIVETPAEEAVVKAANRVVVKNNKLYIETVDGAIINLAGQVVE